MASLRFSFNGKRQPEREIRRPFFPYPQRHLRYLDAPLTTNYKNVDAEQESMEEKKESIQITDNQQWIDEKEEYIEELVEEEEKEQKISPSVIKEENTKSKSEEIPPIKVSEQLVSQLTVVENNVVKVRGHVDTARSLFDEVLYKIESFIQIMEIVSNNEERRINGKQAQLSSVQKESKDTVDEIIELLQTPAFQSVLRQVLVKVLVKK